MKVLKMLVKPMTGQSKNMSNIKYKIFIFIIASVYIALIWQDIMYY